VQKAQGYW